MFRFGSIFSGLMNFFVWWDGCSCCWMLSKLWEIKGSSLCLVAETLDFQRLAYGSDYFCCLEFKSPFGFLPIFVQVLASCVWVVCINVNLAEWVASTETILLSFFIAEIFFVHAWNSSSKLHLNPLKFPLLPLWPRNFENLINWVPWISQQCTIGPITWLIWSILFLYSLHCCWYVLVRLL